MSSPTDDLPEGSIVLGALTLLDYLDEAGVESYSVAVTGAVPVVKALGLLELAKANLLAQQRDP